jgi:hypothetical protein
VRTVSLCSVPWSATACSVGSGIVFTTPLVTSSTT